MGLSVFLGLVECSLNFQKRKDRKDKKKREQSMRVQIE